MELTSINSEAPALVAQALWVDNAGTSFYAFDGGVSGTLPFNELPPPPPNELWQFTPSGNSGHWSLVDPLASSIFSGLIRGYHGIYTSGAGLGFALGGAENYATTNEIGASTLTNEISASTFRIPGMVMYNITSQNWYNVSASGYSPDGVAMDGAAQFVPSFGPAGLLFVFGGSLANNIFPGTDEVSIFEPISQQWSSQEVSGAKPSSVLSPCVVGAQGDNNTYEVKNDRNLTETEAYKPTHRFFCMVALAKTPMLQSLKARSTCFPCRPSIGRNKTLHPNMAVGSTVAISLGIDKWSRSAAWWQMFP